MTVDVQNHLPSDKEFQLFQRLILARLGIHLPPQKKALLSNRLWKRLQACGSKDFNDYYQFIISQQGRDELDRALELVTTNETYFFREQKHFDFMQEDLLTKLSSSASFRVWSAAASTGEESYSIAMLLRDRCPCQWEILSSDVNGSVLDQARLGIYPESRARNIPDNYLRRFCRKGVGPQQGNIRVDADLRARVSFFQLNLHESFPDIGKFDLVFLRNVLIYFENETKAQVLNRIAETLKPGGYLFVGHSESLHGLCNRFLPIKPAIYRLKSA